MRLDQLPRSENVDDRRGGTDSGGGATRIPGGRGGIGIGTLIVLALVGWFLGIDPRLLIEGTDILTGGDRTQQQTPDTPDTREAQGPSDQMKEFVSAVLGSWNNARETHARTILPRRVVDPRPCRGVARPGQQVRYLHVAVP